MSFGSQTLLVGISSPVCCQDATHRSAPKVQAAGDLGFADACPVELANLVSVEGRGDWPSQALAVLASMRQAGTDTFPQNLPFELREHG
jgi:hypothetical protein